VLYLVLLQLVIKLFNFQGGAYTPGNYFFIKIGMSSYVVMVKDKAKVFLGGPPLGFLII
jgi:hypothetical protein